MPPQWKHTVLQQTMPCNQNIVPDASDAISADDRLFRPYTALPFPLANTIGIQVIPVLHKLFGFFLKVCIVKLSIIRRFSSPFKIAQISDMSSWIIFSNVLFLIIKRFEYSMPRNNVIQHFYKVKQLIHISHQINNQKYVLE